MTEWQNGKTMPGVVSVQQGGDDVTLTLKVAEDLFQFRGHFPGTPVLPGVAQLDWAARFAEQQFGLTIEVTEVAQLKFRSVIMPPVDVALELKLDREKARVTFRFRRDDHIYSSGILKLAAA